MARPLAVAVLGAVLALGTAGPMGRGAFAFPPLAELPATPFMLQDAALASFGMRAAAADIAWIQLLQYAATGNLPGWAGDGRPYGHLKALTLRVARLDPSFRRAYLLGAGMLGWFSDVDRPEEAAELLEEGLRRDPGEKVYSTYLAALAFQKHGNVDRMIAVLESTLDDPRTPALMKPILANIYKSRGEYAKSLALWEIIRDSEDSISEHGRAISQIAELKGLLRAKRTKLRP